MHTPEVCSGFADQVMDRFSSLCATRGFAGVMAQAGRAAAASGSVGALLLTLPAACVHLPKNI